MADKIHPLDDAVQLSPQQQLLVYLDDLKGKLSATNEQIKKHADELQKQRLHLEQANVAYRAQQALFDVITAKTKELLQPSTEPNLTAQ